LAADIRRGRVSRRFFECSSLNHAGTGLRPAAHKPVRWWSTNDFQVRMSTAGTGQRTLFINTSPIWPELATGFGSVRWWSAAERRAQTAAGRRSSLNVVRPHHHLRPHHRRRSVLACQSPAEQVASRILRRRHRHRRLPTRLLLPLHPMTSLRPHSPTTSTNTAALPR